MSFSPRSGQRIHPILYFFILFSISTFFPWPPQSPLFQIGTFRGCLEGCGSGIVRSLPEEIAKRVMALSSESSAEGGDREEPQCSLTRMRLPLKGEAGFLLAHQLIGRALSIPGATVHWYDKPEMRKQRKMGHITIVGPSMGTVERRLKSLLNEECSGGQTDDTPRVGIIMGSDSDLPVMKEADKILDMFGVPKEALPLKMMDCIALCNAL